MKTAFLAIGVLVASSAFGQTQSTTNTTCTANGQQINCTSATATTADAAAQRAETQREINEAGANTGYALGTAIRAIKNKHDAKKAEKAAEEARAANEKATNTLMLESAPETDKFRIIHCAQSPGERTTNESGNIISCSDFMAKMKSFCAAAPKYAACEYLSTQPPHEMPVGELSPIVKEAVENGVRADIAYCQKHPDSNIPQASGHALSCTDEIQQQQAFCKTNPGALRCSQFDTSPEQTAKDNAAPSVPKD